MVELTYIAMALMAIGSTIAVLRDKIGDSWFMYHRALQTSALIVLTFAVFKDEIWQTGYKQAMLAAIVAQAVWAMIIRGNVERETFLWGHRLLAVAVWGVLLTQLASSRSKMISDV